MTKRKRRIVTLPSKAIAALWTCLALLGATGCQKEKTAEAEPAHPAGEIWLSPERATKGGILVDTVKEQWVGDAIVTFPALAGAGPTFTVPLTSEQANAAMSTGTYRGAAHAQPTSVMEFILRCPQGQSDDPT